MNQLLNCSFLFAYAILKNDVILNFGNLKFREFGNLKFRELRSLGTSELALGCPDKFDRGQIPCVTALTPKSFGMYSIVFIRDMLVEIKEK